MLSLSDMNQTDFIEACSSSSRHLDGILNIDNPFLNKWCVRYIHLNFSLIKRTRVILKPPFSPWTCP